MSVVFSLFVTADFLLHKPLTLLNANSPHITQAYPVVDRFILLACLRNRVTYRTQPEALRNVQYCQFWARGHFWSSTKMSGDFSKAAGLWTVNVRSIYNRMRMRIDIVTVEGFRVVMEFLHPSCFKTSHKSVKMRGERQIFWLTMRTVLL